MLIGDLSRDALASSLARESLSFRTGPFTVRLQCDFADCAETWQQAYGALELLEDGAPRHFRVELHHGRGARRWVRRQVNFRCDGREPFEPYPATHAFPLFEWGLNWCIAHMAQYYLLLHSAVVEKGGLAVVLPAAPGSGKSTLCAGLVASGWRLLSDEFGILRHEDGALLPLPRPAPLKNRSIDVMRDFAPQLRYGPRYDRTRKGDVVHLFPPADSLRRQTEPARPRWVIFPRFKQGAALRLTPQPKTLAIARLVNNAFNYPVTGEAGFRTLCRFVRAVDCYELVNGSLDDAVRCIEELAAEASLEASPLPE
jgi:HprK-related kinase A